MFEFLRKKKQQQTFDPNKQVIHLTQLGPPSALVYLSTDKTAEPENLGKAFFLRQDKKLYTEGTSLYITTPENLKIAKNQKFDALQFTLQFFHRRVPHKIDCRIIGRFRLLPEVIETLDFNTKAAFKITPIGRIKKDEKRFHKRYCLLNYGDSRIPLTTHVQFEVFIKNTNHEFPLEGAPPPLIKDLHTIDFKKSNSASFFTTRDVINEFRNLMLSKAPHERYVHLAKIVKGQASGLNKDEEYLLGQTNVLALEMESLRDVLYLKKSSKSVVKRGKDNPYNLQAGEKILTRFEHQRAYYEMLCEVMEARTQNEVVRPLEHIRSESGIHVTVVDYSNGGMLVESSPDFLKFLLGDECPTDVDDNPNYASPNWQQVLELLKSRMLHTTFYPKLYFPDAVKSYKPEMPFKFSLIAQVVRTHLRRLSEGQLILQHGLQFNYESLGIPLEHNEVVPWRYTREVKDNEHLKKAHTSLSQLYGYLENQSLSSGSSGSSGSGTQ